MSFKYVKSRRLAELENELRLAEIELEEERENCCLNERHLVLELLEAKVRLALFKVQDYALLNQLTSPRLNCSRTQTQS